MEMCKLGVGLWMAVQTDCLLWVLSGPGGWDLPASSSTLFHRSFIEFPITMLLLLSGAAVAAELTLHFLCLQASPPIRQADGEADWLLRSASAPARPCLTGIRLTHLMLGRGERAELLVLIAPDIVSGSQGWTAAALLAPSGSAFPGSDSNVQWERFPWNLMEWVDDDAHLSPADALPSPRAPLGSVRNRGRGTEEALAVGGALVLDFDVGAPLTCLWRTRQLPACVRVRMSVCLHLCKMQR